MRLFLQKKIMLSLLVLGLGLFLSIIIAGRGSDMKPASELLQANALQAVNQDLNFQKTNTDASTYSKESLGQSNKTPSLNNNLTNALVEKYVSAIAAQNPSGPQLVDGVQKLKTLDDSSASSLLQSDLAQELSYPRLSEKDIHVSNENSKESQIAYIEHFQAVTQKNFDGSLPRIETMLTNLMNSGDASTLQNYTLHIADEIRDLLALSVPFSWKTFHLENINLWEKKLTAYQAIVQLNDDPLKGYVALNSLTSIVEENQTLQSVLNDNIKSLTQS